MQIRPFHPVDEREVISLWHRCGLIRAWNNPAKDIQRKMRVRPDWFLVGLLDRTLIGSVMVGYDGHRGWLNYLAVDPSWQQHGYGRTLVEHAEQLLRREGCPKINLQIRRSNEGVIEFYRHLGFLIDDVVCMGKRLEQDERSDRPSGTCPP